MPGWADRNAGSTTRRVVQRAHLSNSLSKKDWRTTRWTTKKGITRGGRQFDKHSLHQLLTNVAYVGKVKYKDEVHEGEHDATIDPDVFSQVPTLLRYYDREAA